MSCVCQATGCEIRVKSNKLFCTRHWRMVPYKFQLRILEAYDSAKSSELNYKWISAVKDAIRVVRDIEESSKQRV